MMMMTVNSAKLLTITPAIRRRASHPLRRLLQKLHDAPLDAPQSIVAHIPRQHGVEPPAVPLELRVLVARLRARPYGRGERGREARQQRRREADARRHVVLDIRHVILLLREELFHVHFDARTRGRAGRARRP